jgi:hypothetical protein
VAAPDPCLVASRRTPLCVMPVPGAPVSCLGNSQTCSRPCPCGMVGLLACLLVVQAPLWAVGVPVPVGLLPSTRARCYALQCVSDRVGAFLVYSATALGMWSVSWAARQQGAVYVHARPPARLSCAWSLVLAEAGLVTLVVNKGACNGCCSCCGMNASECSRPCISCSTASVWWPSSLAPWAGACMLARHGAVAASVLLTLNKLCGCWLTGDGGQGHLWASWGAAVDGQG